VLGGSERGGGVRQREVVAFGKERASLAARGRKGEGRRPREAWLGGRRHGGEGRRATAVERGRRSGLAVRSGRGASP
jgi:hypothetical protein